MPPFRHLCQIFVCATLATPFATAHSGSSNNPTELPALPAPIRAEIAEVQTPSYMDQLWSLPIFRFFSPSFVTLPALVSPEADELALMESVPGCMVEPLAEIEDPAALTFEDRTNALGAVDIDGLTPSTQVALARFQRMVTSVGGAIAVTSAYRPAAYQEHLRDVWEKWMIELRSNTDPLCQDLRAQVGDEFRHHTLLESQPPVACVRSHSRIELRRIRPVAAAEAGKAGQRGYARAARRHPQARYRSRSGPLQARYVVRTETKTEKRPAGVVPTGRFHLRPR